MDLIGLSSAFRTWSNQDRALLMIRVLTDVYGNDFKLIRDGSDCILEYCLPDYTLLRVEFVITFPGGENFVRVYRDESVTMDFSGPCTTESELEELFGLFGIDADDLV